MAMAQGESVRASLIRRSDLPETGIVAVDAVIGGEPESILVYCATEALRAWLNVCPHEGRRLDYAPGKFLIDKDRLVCAAHGASFRLADGFCVAGPCRGSSLREVAVQVSGEGELSFGPLL
jgi:nitrite reductase/ring-hydroxylating ferredoxin subunit